jgi:hypothetical protein
VVARARALAVGRVAVKWRWWSSGGSGQLVVADERWWWSSGGFGQLAVADKLWLRSSGSGGGGVVVKRQC